MEELRGFLFGLAQDFPTSPGIQDIASSAYSSLWVKGPLAADLLVDWMTPAKTSWRGHYR